MTAAEQYQLVETRLQEKLENGTVRCNLCLWRCKIGHGQRGFCQAHVNRNGTLYNLSYGILSSIDIDPIEDKPVKHFRPGTQVMSVGSYGCSFRCGGCHNLEISWGVTALGAAVEEDLGDGAALGLHQERAIASDGGGDVASGVGDHVDIPPYMLHTELDPAPIHLLGFQAGRIAFDLPPEARVRELKRKGFSDRRLADILERAKNHLDEITDQGIDPTRVTVRGYGEIRPIADNATEEGRRQNRRTEISIFD